MRSSPKKLVFAALLVLGAAGLAVYSLGFLSLHEFAAQENVQTPKRGHDRDASRKSAAGSGDARKASTAARDAMPTQQPASRVYADSKLDLVDRFHSLMNMESQGDTDARYLAYRMRENCRIAKATSKDTVLPALWSTEMGSALNAVKDRCRPLLDDPVFQDFSARVKDLSTASFDDDIPLHIKEAFANSGSTDAVLTALVAFRRRPDSSTASMVAETLAELDILKYDTRFRIEGPAAVIPAMRRDIFYVALMLYSCDLGVPCGPGSERMLRLCAFGGGCEPPGQSLYEYFANTGSLQNMRNAQSIRDALRRVWLARSQ